MSQDERYWLLTWRTYGTWLPGDARGFVGPVVISAGERVIHNVPGTPVEEPNPRLFAYASTIMTGDVVTLTTEHAGAIFVQLRETAAFRGWNLLALAILINHVHVVVRTPNDRDGADLLRDFKSYASRRLNQGWGKRPNGSWWSESGSRRVLKGEQSIQKAVDYVWNQDSALLLWAMEPTGPPPPGG